MQPLVLCCHLPACRPRERARAMDSIRALAEYPDEWALRLVEMTHPHAYSAALSAAWAEPRTLINVEHDHVVSPEHIRALLSCPWPRCSWTYLCWPVSTGQPHPIVSPSDGSITGAGLIKVEWPRMGPFKSDWTYGNVEFEINRLTGPGWHLHGPPVEHLHGNPRPDLTSALQRRLHAHRIEPDDEPAGRAATLAGGT